MADRVVPRLGFRDDGTRTFDYGVRQITAKLGIDLQVSVLGGTKRATSLPKPLAADDPARAAQAQAEFKQLKAQLKHAIKQQTERMERALVTQRTWTTERWQALFLHHPLLRPLAITLVWGVVAEGETPHDGSPYTLLFRPLDDGTLTDADDTTVTLPQTGHVRLVHPLDLDADTLRMWQQHLADYEIAPPFAQLNRAVVRLDDTLRTARWWVSCLGYVINGATLKGRYLKAGWERGSVQDAGWYSTLLKTFPAAGIQAVLETTGLSIGYEQNVTTALKRLAFVPAGSMRTGSYVYNDLKDDDARIMLLGDVPAVVFSEAAADVQTFAAAGSYAEDWEKQVW